MRKPDEDPDLKLVNALIFMPRGLRLSRFTQEETLPGRTRDFRVLRLDNLVAYCEVKSPRDDWLDNQLDEAPPFTIVGGGRPDPIFNRIVRHVAKAATQFDAVNADRSVLNLLAFVNHDAMSHFADLRETLTGCSMRKAGSGFKPCRTFQNAGSERRSAALIFSSGSTKRKTGLRAMSSTKKAANAL